MAKDKNGFSDYNGSSNVDVNCGQLIPSGNLDKNTPGSYAWMRNELDRTQKGSTTFHAETSYGFKPKMFGQYWGEATFSK